MTSDPTVAAVVPAGKGMDVIGCSRRVGSGVARCEDELGRSAVPKDLFKRVGFLLIDCEGVLLPYFDHAAANQHRFNFGSHSAAS